SPRGYHFDRLSLFLCPSFSLSLACSCFLSSHLSFFLPFQPLSLSLLFYFSPLLSSPLLSLSLSVSLSLWYFSRLLSYICLFVYHLFLLSLCISVVLFLSFFPFCFLKLLPLSFFLSFFLSFLDRKSVV